MLSQEYDGSYWNLIKTGLNNRPEMLMKGVKPFIIVEASNHAQGIARLGKHGLAIQWLMGDQGVDPAKLASWTPLISGSVRAQLGYRWPMIIEKILTLVTDLSVVNLSILTLHRTVAVILETKTELRIYQIDPYDAPFLLDYVAVEEATTESELTIVQSDTALACSWRGVEFHIKAKNAYEVNHGFLSVTRPLSMNDALTQLALCVGQDIKDLNQNAQMSSALKVFFSPLVGAYHAIKHFTTGFCAGVRSRLNRNGLYKDS